MHQECPLPTSRTFWGMRTSLLRLHWWKLTCDSILAVLSSLVAAELARLWRCPARSSVIASIVDDPGRVLDQVVSREQRQTLAFSVAQMFHLPGGVESLMRLATIQDWARFVCDARCESITFRSSGSTGSPKACVHKMQDLEREIGVHIETVKACKRILTLVPRHHIYGFLWTVLLPERLKAGNGRFAGDGPVRSSKSTSIRRLAGGSSLPVEADQQSRGAVC